MGLDVLFWIWVLTWMAKTAATDVLHAVKGTPNPRYELKKQRAAQAGQPVKGQPRYGTREWLSDLYSDALAAHTEKRRAAAKAKGQPVDDIVELVREPRPVPAQRHPHDPNNTRNCPTCKGEVVLDGRPCPNCLAEQQRRNAEWEAQHGEPEWLTPDPDELDGSTSVVHDDQHPYCLEPCGPTCGRFGWVCGSCGTEKKDFVSQAEAEKSHRAHLCPPTASDSQPTARIYQFPNVQQIEKEINMSNPEVTGLSTAIAFADQASTAHTSFATTGAEGYVGALERGGNAGEVIDSAREAMEASGIAADKWAAHRAKLQEQLNLKEAYQAQPDAADKEFLLNG